MGEKKGRNMLFLVIFLIITIVVSGMVIAFYMISADRIQDEGSYDLAVEDYASITKIKIVNEAEVGDFKIRLAEQDADKLIDATWTHEYLSSNDDDSKLVFEEETDGNTLTITISLENDMNDNMLFNSWTCSILLSPDYDSYGVDFDLMTGDIDIKADGIEFNDFLMETRTGKLTLEFSNCVFNDKITMHTSTGAHDLEFRDCVFNDAISSYQATGSLDLVFKDIVFSSDTTIDFTTSTGAISIIWIQDEALTSNIELNVKASTGSVDITIDSPLSITRYDITAGTSTGSVDFDVNGNELEEITENHYRSNNFDDVDADLIDINAGTSTGGVEIAINN